MSPCPEPDVITRLARGALASAAAAQVQRHVADCPACAQRVSSVTADAPGAAVPAVFAPAPHAAAVLERGATFDRYVVLEQLGAGGMGVVFSAYDTKLDRKVALKLLRPRRDDGGLERERARMLREAQAMARLAHPNVVAVHDVSSHRDQLFIVMELIDGSNLRAWLDERSRTAEAIVERFVEAGRGLAAAHAAGIVHRDFKPENVLIGRDGRTRVTDFGVARLDAWPEPPSGVADTAVAGRSATGAAGTLGYLAPERLAGRPADARSDQYAFCVALRDALEPTRAPAAVRATLARGLSADPEARFPSMEALLLELSAGRTRARRLRFAAVVAAVVAAGAWGATRALADPCPGAASALDDVWSDARAAKVRAAFAATNVPYAGKAAEAVEQQLGSTVRTWRAMHHDTCAATKVRGEQSVQLFDLRMECLGQRRRELDAVVAVLETADAKVVERALSSVLSLTPLSTCADVAALQRRPTLPDDPAARARHGELSEQFAAVKAQVAAGRWPEALGRLPALVDASRASKDTQLLAETLFQRAELLSLMEDRKDSESAGYDAVAAALEANDEALTARGLALLTLVVGYQLERPVEGLRLARLAAAATQRAGAGGELEAQLMLGEGKVLQAQGKHAEALERKRRGVELLERAYGAGDLRVASARENVAFTLVRMGRGGEAREIYLRTLELKRGLLGSIHPLLVQPTGAVGDTWTQEGDYAQALASYQEGLRLSEALYGPRHPTTASMHNNLGRVLADMGRFDEAAPHFQVTLEVYAATLGPEHSRVAFVLENRAGMLSGQGRHDEALALVRQALALRLKKLAADHPLVALSRLRAGDELRRLGRCGDAEAEYLQSIAVYEKAAPDDTDLAMARAGLAECARARGRADEALAALELAGRQQAGRANPIERVAVAVSTADALKRLGREPERQQALLAEARELLARTGHRDRAGWERRLAELDLPRH